MANQGRLCANLSFLVAHRLYKATNVPADTELFQDLLRLHNLNLNEDSANPQDQNITAQVISVISHHWVVNGT